jgi:hypothetical protein
VHSPFLQDLSGLGVAFACAAGLGIVGGFVGFLLRPYYPVVGQLPFGTVITRGGNLSGIASVLQSAAEESFQHLLKGAALGAYVGTVIGSVAGCWYAEPRNETPTTQP